MNHGGAKRFRDSDDTANPQAKMQAVVDTLHQHTVKSQMSPSTTKLHVRMAQAREEGLSEPLDASNRGYQLLAKIGYTGGGLGKQGRGICEPVAVNIRSDKAGLGMPAAPSMSQTQASAAAKQNERLTRQAQAHTAAVSRAYMQRKRQQQLMDALTVLEDLDSAAGGQQGAQFMWASQQQAGSQASRSGTAGSQASRSGTAYTVSTDEHPDTICGKKAAVPPSSAAVPVCTQDAAANVHGAAADADVAQVHDEVVWWRALDANMQLSAAVAYMRHAYLYCFWCGSRFASEAALAAQCPGDTEQAHE